MAFCNHCGNPLAEGASFCNKCGTSVPNAVAPSAPAPSNAPNLCPRCHAEVPEGVSFCTKCGMRLTPAEGVVCVYKGMPGSPSSSPSEKKSNKGIIIAVISAVVVIAIVVAVLFLTGVIGGAPTPSSSTSVASSVSTGSSASSAAGTTDSTAGSSSSSASATSGSSSSAAAPAFGGTWASVTASSTLPTTTANYESYAASNVIDGNTESTWCENDSGTGAGEYLVFTAPQKSTFSGFNIWNGFQESEDLYDKNARPKTVEIYADGTLVGTYTLSDSMGSQKVAFEKQVEASVIKLVITSVYEGSRDKDCCISEIAFM